MFPAQTFFNLIFSVINRDEKLKFGLRLKAIRKERLFSQQHLADISNLSKITIQRIEQGKFSVTLDTLISISKALEIKIMTLLTLINLRLHLFGCCLPFRK